MVRRCCDCIFFNTNAEDILNSYVDCGEYDFEECLEKIENAIKKGFGVCEIDGDWKNGNDNACEFFTSHKY